jgi:hypothetical protein
LRRGEEDTGARSHVGPDDELRFDEGSITLELDAIDDVERQGRTGYVPVTPPSGRGSRPELTTR